MVNVVLIAVLCAAIAVVVALMLFLRRKPSGPGECAELDLSLWSLVGPSLTWTLCSHGGM
jgi:hypothetical protein